MNVVPPNTKTLMVSTMAASPFPPLTKADVDLVTSRKSMVTAVAWLAWPACG